MLKSMIQEATGRYMMGVASAILSAIDVPEGTAREIRVRDEGAWMQGRKLGDIPLHQEEEDGVSPQVQSLLFDAVHRVALEALEALGESPNVGGWHFLFRLSREGLGTLAFVPCFLSTQCREHLDRGGMPVEGCHACNQNSTLLRWESDSAHDPLLLLGHLRGIGPSWRELAIAKLRAAMQSASTVGRRTAQADLEEGLRPDVPWGDAEAIARARELPETTRRFELPETPDRTDLLFRAWADAYGWVLRDEAIALNLRRQEGKLYACMVADGHAPAVLRERTLDRAALAYAISLDAEATESGSRVVFVRGVSATLMNGDEVNAFMVHRSRSRNDGPTPGFVHQCQPLPLAVVTPDASTLAMLRDLVGPERKVTLHDLRRAHAASAQEGRAPPLAMAIEAIRHRRLFYVAGPPQKSERLLEAGSAREALVNAVHLDGGPSPHAHVAGPEGWARSFGWYAGPLQLVPLVLDRLDPNTVGQLTDEAARAHAARLTGVAHLPSQGDLSPLGACVAALCIWAQSGEIHEPLRAWASPAPKAPLTAWDAAHVARAVANLLFQGAVQGYIESKSLRGDGLEDPVIFTLACALTRASIFLGEPVSGHDLGCLASFPEPGSPEASPLRPPLQPRERSLLEALFVSAPQARAWLISRGRRGW